MKIFILFLLIVIPIQSIAETCEEDDVLSAKNCIPEDVDFKELEYVLTKRMRTKSICEDCRNIPIEKILDNPKAKSEKG